MGSLKGTVAIVTGATSGIGAATAVALAQAGAHLTLVGRRAQLLDEAAEKARTYGVQVLTQPLDVTDLAAVERCVAQTRERFGRLDLLAHVAGINTPKRNLRDISPEDWRRVLDVNLTGVFYFVRAVLPIFREAKRGSIVIVGSDSGLTTSELAGVAYCASKFGVTSLVHSINLEERRNGVRACAIQAGEVETPIMEFRPEPPPAERRALMLRAEDVAAAIVYAASQPPHVNVEQIIIRPTLDKPYPEAQELLARWRQG